VKLTTFISRLAKIGVDVELSANIPWIYLKKVNGKSLTRKFHSEHAFTAFYLFWELKFTDRQEVFKEIRRMLNDCN